MFLNICYTLNRLGLSKQVAWLRWHLLNSRIGRGVQEGKYNSEDVPGYEGWLELSPFGVLAFRRSDGSIQYEW